MIKALKLAALAAAVLLLCAGAADGAAFVQQVAATSGSAADKVDVTLTVTGGNGMALACRWEIDIQLDTVTDTKGQTWVEGLARIGAANIYTEGWYTLNAGAGSTTVTADFSANHSGVHCAVHEFSITGGGALDVVGSTGPAFGNPQESSTASNTTTEAYHFGWSTLDGTPTQNANTGFTRRLHSTTSGRRFTTEDQVYTATGTRKSSFTTSASWDHSTGMMVFRQAAAGAAAPKGLMLRGCCE